MRTGMTLIEVVLAVGVFAILMLMVTTLLAATLGGGAKSTLAARSRNEGAYALQTMVSQLKFAREVKTCLVSGGNSISFVTGGETTKTFTLNDVGDFLEIDGSRITSDAVNVTVGSGCTGTFECDGLDSLARKVQVCFDVDTRGGVGAGQTAPVKFKTEVVLRNSE